LVDKQPRGFKKAEAKAKGLLGNQKKLKELVHSAQKKSATKKEQLKSVWKDFQTLLRLLKAWKNKEYNQTPWKTILYASTAILYFVNPFDLIPDFIPLAGFIDDITIISFVIGSIKEDLEKFIKWEEETMLK